MTTTFKYGGTSLTTFGVVTLLDDYLDIPERRGDNITVPYRHGTMFAAKYYDQRTITIGIVVTAASATALETAMDTMRTLFSLQTEQTLEMTLSSTAVRNISATVERAIQFNRLAPTIGRVVVEFVCCSPYWRLSTVITDNTTTIDATPHAMTVANPGTVEEHNATIILTGPLQNTVITNSTTGTSLTYTGTIASPRVVTISRSAYGEYTALTDLGANVIGNVTHSGSASLLVFTPGNNTLSITDSTHTSGSVRINFFAPFL